MIAEVKNNPVDSVTSNSVLNVIPDKKKRYSHIELSYKAFVLADQNNDAGNLLAERKQVITQYVSDLQKADYKDISNLFEKNGFVVSTSRGYINAKDFFYAFLPNIETASTQIHQTFLSDMDVNRYGARFHLNFKLKDGETGNGEYIDEFVFSDHSSKLAAVYMFENLKFDDLP